MHASDLFIRFWWRGHIDLLIYSIIHQIILSNKQSQGRNYNILLVWQAELTSVILVLKPQISVASVIRSHTHIHSVNAPILRDTSKKPQVSKSQYSSFFFFLFWFQVRATNNIDNQLKSGASKHTDKYLIYNTVVFMYSGGGACLNSKFVLKLLKNVTGSTMHTIRFLFL